MAGENNELNEQLNKIFSDINKHEAEDDGGIGEQVDNLTDYNPDPAQSDRHLSDFIDTMNQQWYWNESVGKLKEEFEKMKQNHTNIAEGSNDFLSRFRNIINSNAGHSFINAPYVNPDKNINNKEYETIRGNDAIASVLKNNKELQFTHTQDQLINMNGYLRLLMPKYSRRVEVEDLNRNFWAIGQTVGLISAHLLNPESMLNQILSAMISEIAEIWNNIFELWFNISSIWNDLSSIKEMLGFGNIIELDLEYDGQSLKKEAYFNMINRYSLSKLNVKLKSTFGERTIGNLFEKATTTNNYFTKGLVSKNVPWERRAEYNKYINNNKLKNCLTSLFVVRKAGEGEGAYYTMDDLLKNLSSETAREVDFKFDYESTIEIFYYDSNFYNCTVSNGNSILKPIQTDKYKGQLEFEMNEEHQCILVPRADLVDGEIIQICLNVNKGKQMYDIGTFNQLLEGKNVTNKKTNSTKIVLRLQDNIASSYKTYNSEDYLAFYDSTPIIDNDKPFKSINDFFNSNITYIGYYNTQKNKAGKSAYIPWKVSCYATTLNTLSTNIISNNLITGISDGAIITPTIADSCYPFLETGTLGDLEITTKGCLILNGTDFLHKPSILLYPISNQDKASSNRAILSNPTTFNYSALTNPLSIANGKEANKIIISKMSVNYDKAAVNDNVPEPIILLYLRRRNTGNYMVKKIQPTYLVINGEQGEFNKYIPDQVAILRQNGDNGFTIKSINSVNWQNLTTLSLDGQSIEHIKYLDINIPDLPQKNSGYVYIFRNNGNQPEDNERYVTMRNMFVFGQLDAPVSDNGLGES